MKTKNWLGIIGVLCLTVGLMQPVCGKQKNIKIRKSGVMLKNTYRPGPFTQIKVGRIFDVEVYPSDADSVVIIADESLMPYIELRLEGRTLHPDMAFKGFRNVSIEVADPLVKVYCRQLTGIEVSGGSELETRGVCDAGGGKFRAHCSGASEAVLALTGVGDLVAEMSGAAEVAISLAEGTSSVMCRTSGASKLDLRTGALSDFIGEVSGASELKLSGSAEKASMEASGAAGLRAGNFVIQTAVIQASGGANAELAVEKHLQATASGAGCIVFSGNAAYTANTSGAGSVSKR